MDNQPSGEAAEIIALHVDAGNPESHTQCPEENQASFGQDDNGTEIKELSKYEQTAHAIQLCREPLCKKTERPHEREKCISAHSGAEAANPRDGILASFSFCSFFELSPKKLY